MEDDNVSVSAFVHNPRGSLPPSRLPHELQFGTERGPASPEGLELALLLTTLRDNRGLIIRLTLIVSAVISAWMLLSRMQFTSTSRIYFGELEDSARSQPASTEELDLSTGHSDLGSEVEILRSRSLTSRAVLSSGLNVWLRPFNWAPPRYWRWRLANRAPSLMDPVSEFAVVNASLADATAHSASFVIDFVSATDYEVTRANTVVGRGKLGEPATFPDVSLTLVPGTDRYPTTGSRYLLTVGSLSDAIDDALKVLDISTQTKGATSADPAKVASLRFSDRSPVKAAKFLEALMQAYLDERQSWKTAEATAAEAFVGEQLKVTRGALDRIQAQLADYRTKNRVTVVNLDAEAKAMVEQMGQFEEERVTARLQADSLASVLSALKNPNAPVEAYMMGDATDPVLNGLGTSLAEGRRKATDLASRFNETAPQVREQQMQVAAQLRTFDGYVTSKLNRERETVRMLDDVIQQHENKLKSVPAAEIGLAQLTREAEVYSSIYSYLLKRQQEAGIVRASTISKNRVLDPASVADHEDWPKLSFVLASMPLGWLLGAIFVVVRGLISSTIQNEVDIRKMFGPLPIYASLPKEVAPRRADSPALWSERLEDLPSSCLEAFRTLRTNLYYATQRERGTIIIVTSPTKADGKTSCAFRLASTLALAGQSTLLIDADLRRSSTQNGRVGPDGLAGVLFGKIGWREAIRDVAVSPQAQFQTLDNGPGAPADLLSSVPMHHLLADARRIYDFLILDVPCFPEVSDALLLSGFADCILTVVRLEHTSRRLTLEHVRRLASTVPAYGLVVQRARA